MRRFLVIALVLLLAAAAGMWAMQAATTATPNAPASRPDVDAADAKIEQGSVPAAVEQISVQIERAAAATAEATTTKPASAVLRVHAFYVVPEHKESPAGNEQSATGVPITLRQASSGYAYASRERVVTNKAGLATFVGVPPGKWNPRSVRVGLSPK